MIEEYVGQKVVIDLGSPYVCMGLLTRVDEHFLEVKNADLHDLRDTETSRENYVVESRDTGIKRNRKSVLVVRSDVVALARPVLRHRMALNFSARADGVVLPDVIDRLVARFA